MLQKTGSSWQLRCVSFSLRFHRKPELLAILVALDVKGRHRAEMKVVRGDMKETVQMAKEDFDVMTDQEVEVAVNKMLDNRRKELDITLRYHEQFKKVLNIRKVAKLYKAEHEFTQILLQRLQERQNGTGPAGGGGGPAGGRPGGPAGGGQRPGGGRPGGRF